MMTLILLLVLALLSLAKCTLEPEQLPDVLKGDPKKIDHYVKFAQHVGRHFKDTEEAQMRFDLFVSRFATLKEENGKHKKSIVGNTKFIDMTEEEMKQFARPTISAKIKRDVTYMTEDDFLKQFAQYPFTYTVIYPNGTSVETKYNEDGTVSTKVLRGGKNGNVITTTYAPPRAAPRSVDWVAKGFGTPVKQQGECGSCWAFATTALLEMANKIAGKNVGSLSEQQLVDCDQNNWGCEGGSRVSSLYYVKANGLQSDKDYPYVEANRTCSVNKGKTISPLFNQTKSFESEEELRDWIAFQGPASASIFIDMNIYMHYGKNVYTPTANECGLEGNFGDHAIVIVGYGTDEDGQDYWIYKNSWGTNWGDEGYGRLARGINACGLFHPTHSRPLAVTV